MRESIFPMSTKNEVLITREQIASGVARIGQQITRDFAGQNVILVEDILDTGFTYNFLRKLLLARKPRTLKFAALLDKPSRRQVQVEADYVGFNIEDRFVVGYG